MGNQREYNKLYNIKHKKLLADKRKAYYKVYFPNNKLKILEQQKLYKSKPKNRILSILYSSKIRAKKRNIPFDMELYKLAENVPSNCFCCKSRLDYRIGQRRSRKNLTPSLDRLDNNLGYTVDNTKVVCFKCNVLKSDASLEDINNFYNYVNKIPSINSDFLLWI